MIKKKGKHVFDQEKNEDPWKKRKTRFKHSRKKKENKKENDQEKERNQNLDHAVEFTKLNFRRYESLFAVLQLLITRTDILKKASTFALYFLLTFSIFSKLNIIVA